MSRRAADTTAEPFSEKGFYLSELRDRTIAIAAPAELLSEPVELVQVLDELSDNQSGVVLISDRADAIAAPFHAPVENIEPLDSLAARVWRGFGDRRRAGVVAARDFERGCAAVVSRLGIRKVVWVDAAGGLVRDGGGRDSFIDTGDLQARLAADADPRDALLREIASMLSSGVTAVNLCTLAGVADELFTYDGSGTLFTAEGYVDVRNLGIDDFDAAADLIERGMKEGYLAPRSGSAIERVLESGYGAFVGGDHLAGIGTLLIHAEDHAAEIASLYTLTRFVGEGVGGHLVRFAIEQAAAQKCRYVFACTTADRVVAFFERNGFRSVEADAVPAAKWHDYDPARRDKVRCLRRDL
jgi:amino-acid N-acetyltransferase